jgi:5,10-methylenetetrahydromethanopterin reductase
MSRVDRIGLELAGEPSVHEMISIARVAEDLGYDSVWLTETRFTRDAVTTAAAIAASTSRLRVGTAVVNPYTRSAVLTAVTAATLDELAAGRFVLGIGPGSPTVLARQGIEFVRPLTRLRESVSTIRALLRGETANSVGQTISINGAALEFAPLRPNIPIYLGVTGPRALELAGEIADGVILNSFVSTAYTRSAVQRIRASAQRAGRDSEDIEIAQSIVVSLSGDARRARDEVRPIIAIYLSQFPNIAAQSGIAPTVLESIRTFMAEGGPRLAASAITDGIVDALTISGTAETCRRQIAKRRACGVDLPIVSFVHGCLPEDLAVLTS